MADAAFAWAVKNKGVASEAAYPYTGSGGACRAASVPNAIPVTGFKDVPPNSEAALEAALARAVRRAGGSRVRDSVKGSIVKIAASRIYAWNHGRAASLSFPTHLS